MKKLLYSILFILAIAGYSYGDTVVDGISGGGGVSEGDDVTFGSGIFNTTLDDATGNEVAVLLNVTTNKLTSGNDTILEIRGWDTASPDTSYGINYTVNGSTKFYVDNVGLGKLQGGLITSSIQSRVDSQSVNIQAGRTFTTGGAKAVTVTGSHTGNTGTIGLSIQPTWNQTGSAYGTDLLINRKETAIGSGDQLLFDAQVDDVSKFSIDNNGSSDTGGAVAFSGISTATVDYTIGNFKDDPTFFIECDATLGNISTTLPPVADKKGRLLEVKLLSAANGCYVDGNGAETIDGVSGKTITTLNDSISFIAGSSQWLVH